MLETTQRSYVGLYMYDVYYHIIQKVMYTNVFNYHFQGQPSRPGIMILGFLRSLTLENLEMLDLTPRYNMYIHLELRKVIQCMCMTLSSEVKR